MHSVYILLIFKILNIIYWKGNKFGRNSRRCVLTAKRYSSHWHYQGSDNIRIDFITPHKSRILCSLKSVVETETFFFCFMLLLLLPLLTACSQFPKKFKNYSRIPISLNLLLFEAIFWSHEQMCYEEFTLIPIHLYISSFLWEVGEIKNPLY